MIPLEHLHEQNHKIGELAKTLEYMFNDRELCDSTVSNELFDRYLKLFDEHMSHNKDIYATLLNHSDQTVRHTVEKFIEGEREIKRVFKDYSLKWCPKGLYIDDHDAFSAETEEMFNLVWERIQAESEQLYPLYRAHN